MKRFSILSSRRLLLAAILAAPAFAFAQTKTETSEEPAKPHWSWRVTYIANEGVLLGRDENSVLIDALFRDGVAGYDRLDSFTQNFIESGGRPFDKVALVLATHKHADHFDASAVARFLRENEEAVFASSPQVAELLLPLVAGDAGMVKRVRKVDPEGGDTVAFSVGDLKVEALRLSHGDGMETLTNLGFIVHMGDRRVLHVGDAHLSEETMASLMRHAANVDAACVPYWWLLEEQGRSFVRDTLNAKRVIAIHIPPAEAEKIRSQIREADSSFVVLLKYTQSINFGR